MIERDGIRIRGGQRRCPRRMDRRRLDLMGCDCGGRELDLREQRRGVLSGEGHGRQGRGRWRYHDRGGYGRGGHGRREDLELHLLQRTRGQRRQGLELHRDLQEEGLDELLVARRQAGIHGTTEEGGWQV